MLRKLILWLRRLWYRNPGRLKEVTMADRKVTWVLPEVGPRQTTIAFVRVEFRVSAQFDWTVQDMVPPNLPQEVVFTDPNPGEWEYRLTVVDDVGQESEPVLVSKAVPFDPPGAVSNVEVIDL